MRFCLEAVFERSDLITCEVNEGGIYEGFKLNRQIWSNLSLHCSPRRHFALETEASDASN